MKKFLQDIKPKLILLGLCISFMISCKKDDNNNPNGSLSPTISIMPTSGVAGTTVTITGSGFGTDTSQIKVTFNGKPAMIQVASNTTIAVTVPNATTGPVVVSVSGKKVQGPVYAFQSLSITAISPNEGVTGTTVTITGAGFAYNNNLQDLQPAVTFNGKTALVTSVSPTQLVVNVPDSVGNGPLVVTLGDQKATAPTFYFLGINTVSPLSGGAGTKITINGGFGPDKTKVSVSINGNPGTINSFSTTQIVATVPPGSGSGPITVTINGQTVTSGVFTYVPPPTISSVLPSSGPAGTSVTISGTGFSTVTSQESVTFNGLAATISQAGATNLTVTVPAKASTGAVGVNVNGQVAAGAVFKVQSLGIISVTPPNGPAGTVVTIAGTGFNPVASQNQVSFNGTPAVVKSATTTQLVVTVPPGFTPGPLTVTTGGLTATDPLFQGKIPGVTTIAGGTLNPNQFSAPAGIAIDGAGNVYVSDYNLNNIQKINITTGTVTLFAGSPNGTPGYTDAQGANALFNIPNDLAFDKQGNLYVADQGNAVIRKITPDGSVSTLAQIPNSDPVWGVATDVSGNIYASDWSGSIDDDYEFSPSGTLINTLAMNDGARLAGLTVDKSGNVYTIDKRGNGIFKNTNTSFFNNNYLSSNADRGLCLDNNGNLVILDYPNGLIELLNPQTLTFSIITGGGGSGNTNSGYQDGPLGTALFNGPIGAKVDAYGNIYVADQGNAAIRKIVLP